MTNFKRNVLSMLTNKGGFKAIGLGVLLLGTILLSGCHHEGMMFPRGHIALVEYKLLIFSTLLMLFVAIPVFILSFWVAWHYREGRDATYRPNWSHSTLLEIVWWAIPCAIILILSILVWRTTHGLDPYKPLKSDKQPVVINVIALDWKWLFIYPEYHIATINEIAVPVGRPINFNITAAAPMNSFIIPQLGGQIYAMAGMKTKLHLIADKPGRYRGFSANYTGDGFAHMQFYAYATSEEGFNAWIQKVRAGSVGALTWDVFWQQLFKQSTADPVKYFGHANGQLFDEVVMSYMTPHYKPEGATVSAPVNTGERTIIEHSS